MNNTKNILLMAAITSLLIMGTAITPMQSYASEHKKTGDFKDSIKASTEIDKKTANQHQDQDNFCYRSDNCRQANEGQQIVGKDNEGKGFNDQSDNLAISTSAAGAGNGTGNGTGTGGTTTLQQKCELCLLNVDLSDFFDNGIVMASGIDSIAELCAGLAEGTLPTPVKEVFLSVLLDPQEQCLIAAGIDFLSFVPHNRKEIPDSEKDT